MSRSEAVEGIHSARRNTERATQTPFVGQISYQEILDVLSDQICRMNWNERKLVKQLLDYLELKLSQRSKDPPQKVPKH